MLCNRAEFKVGEENKPVLRRYSSLLQLFLTTILRTIIFDNKTFSPFEHIIFEGKLIKHLLSKMDEIFFL